MNKLFTLFAVMMMAMTAFAQTTLTSVTINFVGYPKAGDSYNGTIWDASNFAEYANVDPDANYVINYISFYAQDGNNIPTKNFNPNTAYKIQVALKPKDGYNFSNSLDFYYNIADNGEFYGTRHWNSQSCAVTVNFTTGDASMLSTPVSSYNGVWFDDEKTFSLTCGTEGAEIYYTLDGTTPSKTNGTLYTEPFLVEATGSNITLSAIAIKGEESSDVITLTFKTVLLEHSVNAYDVAQGTITTEYDKYNTKSTVDVIVIPAQGYQLKEGSLKMSYTDQSGTLQTKYISGSSFVMPQYNVTLSGEFEESTPTAIDAVNTEKTGKAVKTIENGKVVIIRNGKKYDITGREL